MSNFSSSVATQVAGRSLSMQQQLTALHQISVVLSRSLDIEQTLGSMLQTLHDHAQMQYGLVSCSITTAAPSSSRPCTASMPR